MHVTMIKYRDINILNNSMNVNKDFNMDIYIGIRNVIHISFVMFLLCIRILVYDCQT